MRTNALKVVLGLGLAAALFSGPACSSDEDDGSAGTAATGGGGKGGTSGTGGTAGTAGTAGTGDAAPAPPTVCAGVTCEAGPTVPVLNVQVGTCCSAAEKCGLDTSLLAAAGITFDPVCQERNQPGDLNAACPLSPAIPVSTYSIEPFDGCCRPDGKCGHMLNEAVVTGLGTLELKLGCVDTESLLDGGTAPSCTPGAGTGGTGGTAGEGGQAGAP